MENIYDNGTILLGKINNIKNYVRKNFENFEEFEELIQDLEEFDEETIVTINYDNGMGYIINYWEKKDILGVEDYEF